jgi:oligopeptide/dipeptide ABC transporter ATP-binding protein
VSTAPLVSVEGLSKHFPVRTGLLRRAMNQAVDNVSFTIERGEIVGLVGESGSGKSTLGRAILRLIEPTAGHVEFDGIDVLKARPTDLRALRRQMQIIFQDPFGSLDPRRDVASLLGEAVGAGSVENARQRGERVVDLLRQVGLGAEHLHRYPHEFSGGQRQRIGIARALAVGPSFIVADEPVSALDVSVQAQIVNLLLDLQERLGLAILFISHDLNLVEYVSDRVIVLYLGRIVEIGSARQIYETPSHPYTEALLSAAPAFNSAAKRQPIVLGGEIPSPTAPPSGCVFRTRCRYAQPACAETRPPLRPIADGHATACLRDDVL